MGANIGATKPANPATVVFAFIFFAQFTQIGIEIAHIINKTVISIPGALTSKSWDGYDKTRHQEPLRAYKGFPL